MEVMLRCSVPDLPGQLGVLTSAIGEAGGDIQAVDVVEHEDGVALDDLVVIFDDADQLSALVDKLSSLHGVELIHVGPSRGHPGDAITRLAIGLEAILSGASTRDEGVRTLLGGLLRASSADLVAANDAPAPTAKRLVLPVGDHLLILTRDYRFTRTERERADATIRVALDAARSA
jgi:hypothetical protein